MLKHKLQYQHDSAQLFARIADQPWAMFLDSGQAINVNTGKPGSEYGRYDILVADPIVTLVTQGNETAIKQADELKVSTDDPFLLLKELLSEYPKSSTDFIFAGGAVGYFAYDLARRLEKFASHSMAETIPEMMVGIYDWAVIVDHHQQSSCLVSNAYSKHTVDRWAFLCEQFESDYVEELTGFSVNSEIGSNFSKATYQNAFDQVQSYISAGDCYQVNLAQRFTAKATGNAWLAYQQLRKLNPAPFMAFMQLPKDNNTNFQVLSDSPERFVQVIKTHVETRPIKGTRPRADNAKQDLVNAKELEASLKDRAENVMIVDLLRNDIGKVCETGSVKVKKLFQLQSFANVHHLVSIITGKLKKELTAVDLLRACFPGGSITGAPKVRAMQIIDELEPHRRGIYCGAIGYIGFDGNMDTSIAIRTAVMNNQELSFYAGGGIVADSECEKEYTETLDKAASITKVANQFTK